MIASFYCTHVFQMSAMSKASLDLLCVLRGCVSLGLVLTGILGGERLCGAVGLFPLTDGLRHKHLDTSHSLAFCPWSSFQQPTGLLPALLTCCCCSGQFLLMFASQYLGSVGLQPESRAPGGPALVGSRQHGRRGCLRDAHCCTLLSPHLRSVSHGFRSD